MSDDSPFPLSSDARGKMPWLIIARSVSIALDFRVIIFAAVALVATVAGWRLLDDVFSGSDDPTLRNEWAERSAHVLDDDDNWLKDDDGKAVMAPDRAWPWEDDTIAGVTNPNVSLIESSWWLNTPLVRVWEWFTEPTFHMFKRQTGFTGFVCLLLSTMWAAVVWGLFGGAITRYAAVALTTEERLGWRQMFWEARARWLSYASAPMIPIFAALAFAIPLIIGGWIMNIPQVGPFVIGLLYFLVIIGGIVMTVVLVPPLFGWPFMWSTVSTEGSDAMDGCSRCYSYVWQRPLNFLCYLLFAGLLSWISLLLVGFLVAVIGALSAWGVGLGAGPELMGEFSRGELTELAGAGSSLFAFWSGALRLVVPAYAFGFFFIAMTAIYLVLRYHVDGAELDEVFLEEDPEPLAALGEDAAGVPTAPTADEAKDADSSADDEESKEESGE